MMLDKFFSCNRKADIRKTAVILTLCNPATFNDRGINVSPSACLSIFDALSQKNKIRFTLIQGLKTLSVAMVTWYFSHCP